MWYRLLIFGAFCFWLSQPISANASEQQDNMVSKKHAHCEERNTLQSTFCMSRELEESNDRLNVVYRTLMHALAKPQALQSTQRAWIVFSDAERKFQNQAVKGGSSYNFSVDLCLMQLTEQRISALEEVRPCNGCVEFKDEYYGRQKIFSFPERKRIPASGER